MNFDWDYLTWKAEGGRLSIISTADFRKHYGYQHMIGGVGGHNLPMKCKPEAFQSTTVLKPRMMLCFNITQVILIKGWCKATTIYCCPWLIQPTNPEAEKDTPIPGSVPPTHVLQDSSYEYNLILMHNS